MNQLSLLQSVPRLERKAIVLTYWSIDICELVLTSFDALAILTRKEKCLDGM